MVVEKLKEREDKKDAWEDAKILKSCEIEIKNVQDNMKNLKDRLNKLFDQYLMIKGERHPDDFRSNE